MPFINPYIAKVQDNTHIIEEKEVASKYQGKWNTFFGNESTLSLEIGTGLGNFFSSQVKSFPDKNFIGMEIKFKRVYKTFEKSSKGGKHKNFVVLKRYAQEIREIFGECEIQETYILFPDPWDNKDSQKKHKLLQQDFLEDLSSITKLGGKCIFKTDHKKYFLEVLEIVKDIISWEITVSSLDYEKELESFNKKDITEFEGLFRGEKKQICYAEFVRV